MGVEIVFISNLKEVLGKIDETVRDRMWIAINEIRNETLVTLSGQRSGRVYRVPGTKRTYTASAPGEPPASRLGELRQSITGRIEADSGEIAKVWREKGSNSDSKNPPGKGTQSQLVGMVGTNTKQGLMTEFGTSRMAPRPWLRKSFERSEAKVKEIFTRLWFT